MSGSFGQKADSTLIPNLEASKRAAWELFPDSGVIDSGLYRKVVELQKMRRMVLGFLDNPDWPLIVTREAAASLGIAPVQPARKPVVRDSSDFFKSAGSLSNLFGEGGQVGGCLKHDGTQGFSQALEAALRMRKISPTYVVSSLVNACLPVDASASGSPTRWPSEIPGIRSLTIYSTNQPSFQKIVDQLGQPDLFEREANMTFFSYGLVSFGVYKGSVLQLRFSICAPKDPFGENDSRAAEHAYQTWKEAYQDKVEASGELKFGPSAWFQGADGIPVLVRDQNLGMDLMISQYSVSKHPISNFAGKGILEIGGIEIGPNVRWINGTNGVAIARAEAAEFDRLALLAKDLDLANETSWQRLAAAADEGLGVREIAFFDFGVVANLARGKEFVFFDLVTPK